MHIGTGHKKIVAARADSLDHDLFLAVAGAIILLSLVLVGEYIWFLLPLRVLLGLTYVLYVPGYVLTTALFPGRDDLDTVERLGLSIGLSIAIVPILTLLLSWMPGGIRPWPIVLAECGIILLFIAVTCWQRSRLPEQPMYAPIVSWRWPAWWRVLPSPKRRIYALFAALLLLASVLTIQAFQTPAPDTFLTEFYMVGADGLVQDYPREATVGDELSLKIGIVNREHDARTYRVEVWAICPCRYDLLMTCTNVHTFLPDDPRQHRARPGYSALPTRPCS